MVSTDDENLSGQTQDLTLSDGLQHKPAEVDMIAPDLDVDDKTETAAADEQTDSKPLSRKARDKLKWKKKKGIAEGPKEPKQPKPTGFEDYYVDPPLTPAEHSEEQSLYHASKSFPERYMLAIARYTNRRKFDEARLRIFDKYLLYGGVGTGVKAFQGRVEEKAPDQTAIDTAMLKSKYCIRGNTLEESDVDFATVVQGFLSSYLPWVQEMHHAEDFKICTNVIRNFLNYLLYHDVCPEYADQIYDAKKVCDDADTQLPTCAQLARALPGSFNTAVSLLFGGQSADTYIDDIEQAKSFGLDPGLRREDAVKIFLAGLAALGTADMVELYNKQAANSTISIVEQIQGYWEVIAITPPSQEILSLYGLASQRDLRPIGTVTLRPWRHPTGPFPEMTPIEVAAYKAATATGNYPRQEFELFIDIEFLSLLKPGTKINATRYKTSFGLVFLDAVMYVLSPMYAWLKNEAHIGWVEPKALEYKPRPVHLRNEALKNAEAGMGDDGDEMESVKPAKKDDNATVEEGEDNWGEGPGWDVDEKQENGKSNLVFHGDQKENFQEQVKEVKKEICYDSEGEEIPQEYKNYEKGEDIIITM